MLRLAAAHRNFGAIRVVAPQMPALCGCRWATSGSSAAPPPPGGRLAALRAQLAAEEEPGYGQAASHVESFFRPEDADAAQHMQARVTIRYYGFAGADG
jgi:hypothetical protein